MDSLRRQDDLQIEELERRFDAHLQIYAQNGREMARLASAVENLIKSFEEHKQGQDNWRKEIETTLEPLVALDGGAKSFKWFVGILIALGTLILMIKQIWK